MELPFSGIRDELLALSLPDWKHHCAHPECKFVSVDPRRFLKCSRCGAEFCRTKLCRLCGGAPEWYLGYMETSGSIFAENPWLEPCRHWYHSPLLMEWEPTHKKLMFPAAGPSGVCHLCAAKVAPSSPSAQ